MIMARREKKGKLSTNSFEKQMAEKVKGKEARV